MERKAGATTTDALLRAAVRCVNKSKGDVERYTAALKASNVPPYHHHHSSSSRDGDGDEHAAYMLVDTTQPVASFARVNKAGDTMLHVAARQGFVDIMRLLLDSVSDRDGLSIDVKNNVGHTPLHEAVLSGSCELVRLLLQHGADVSVTKHADWSTLHLACTKQGNVEVVKSLVRAGASLTVGNKDGWTPLHIACRCGDIAIVSFLLEASPASLHINSSTARTPLMTASLNGHANVVKCLLAAAADSCGENQRTEGDTGDGGKRNECLPAVEAFVNRRDSSGWTALFWAVIGGQLCCAQTLVANGAQYTSDVTTPEGKTIVHLAAASGDGSEYFSTTEADALAVLEYVVDLCGAAECIDWLDKHGNTPLHLAAMNGHAGHVRVLVEQHGASISALNDRERSPIALAMSGRVGPRKAAVVDYLASLQQ